MRLVALKAPVTDKPRADDFAVINADRPACPDGGVVARVLFISLDPYVGSRLRGRHMGEPAPAPLDEAIPGAIVGEVVESRTPAIKEGDAVHSMNGGWAEFVALGEADCRRLDRALAPLSAHLGVLGMPGLTAWAGVSQLAKIEDGETFLVDAAAGAVGGSAGQIARNLGAGTVVGVAGGPEKCGLVEREYGFDRCVDYKRDGWRDALRDAVGDPAAGGGVDAFFENVSADMATTALLNAKPCVRGVLCGLVANYHDADQAQHPLNAGLLIGKRAQLFGLVVYDFYPRWDEYVAEAAAWLRDGRLTIVEDRAEGLDAAPALFEKLMDGRNIGKCVVALDPDA
ncbi:MAG: NADP-dependent oxidoreductase [Pseudomonadota bacterium]